MPDCLHPSRFQMDGPADGKTRCALCELERVTLDHAAGLHDAATLLLRADRAEREVARLTAALSEYGWHLDNCPAADCSTTKCECGYAALRQPAPAQCPLDDEPCDNCVHGKKWHWDGGKCQNACQCEQYKPAPAQGQE